MKVENIKSLLKSSFSNYDLLIWDESIFSSGNFNDPALNDKKTNHYFKSIKVEEAWKKTTGDSSIIVAIIDDGFDLNHVELRDNVVKPYNILNQNNLVYADENLTHGTHVAGLAIANKNNKIGACGIAPDCSFMPIQIGGHNLILATLVLLMAFYMQLITELTLLIYQFNQSMILLQRILLKMI